MPNAPKYTPIIRGNVVYAKGDAQQMVDDANAAPELADVLRDVNTYFANLRGLKGVTQADSDAIIARVADVLRKLDGGSLRDRIIADHPMRGFNNRHED